MSSQEDLESSASPAGDGKTDRRSFLKTAGKAAVAAGAAVVALGAVSRGLTATDDPGSARRGERGILRPPGALEEKAFLASCIRCDRCLDACDANAILIFGPDRGRNAGTPYIIPRHHACDLCLRCTQACPTGALEKLDDITDVRMGTAIVDERLCVSWNRTGACGACHTICPLKNRAIKQQIFCQPVVNKDHCVGCGMCEETCIVRDRKAIQVFSGRAWS